MTSPPRVTAIIPCYNAASFIHDTIQSVLDQTYGDFEILVLNDGSKDKSEEIIKAHRDPRVRLISKRNSGVADTRNLGVQWAKGEYIAFLDADDLFCADNLKRKVEFLDKNPDCGLVHSEVYLLDMSGNLKARGLKNCQGSVLKPLLEFKTMVNSPSSTLIRKKLLDEVGGFDPALSTSADRDLWIRLATRTRFGFLSEPLVKYRLHPNQMHYNIDAMEADLHSIYQKAKRQKLFESQSHYYRCWSTAEWIIAASYLRHTWKIHKAALHLINAAFQRAMALVN